MRWGRRWTHLWRWRYQGLEPMKGDENTKREVKPDSLVMVEGEGGREGKIGEPTWGRGWERHEPRALPCYGWRYFSSSWIDMYWALLSAQTLILPDAVGHVTWEARFGDRYTLTLMHEYPNKDKYTFSYVDPVGAPISQHCWSTHNTCSMDVYRCSVWWKPNIRSTWAWLLTFLDRLF